MRKKLSLIFMSILTTILFVFSMVASGCDVNIEVNNLQKEHACLNTAFGSVQQLKKEKNSVPHEIEAEIEYWKADRPDNAPFVKAYALSFEYTLEEGETITLGKNVYVSICTYSADLTYDESQIVLSKDENGVVKSGFEVYDCPQTSCFVEMKPAVKVTQNYVDMCYYAAVAYGQSSFAVPAGNYALMEAFPMATYLESGKMVFADPENTVVCFNNTVESESNPEVLALKNRGITVHVECIEGKVADEKHACKYTQGVDPIALTQKKFDTIIADIKAGNVVASDTDLLQNFVYTYLTEDISYQGEFTIPEKLYYGVCKNGFAFDVPEVSNLYVFDCEPHVCAQASFQEIIPVWQAGLDIRFAHAQAAGLNFVLPAGDYALMEDIDCQAYPNLFASETEYSICYNGHTLQGANLPEGQQCVVRDCTQSQESLGLLVHECTEIGNHITPLYITEPLLMQIMGETGFVLPNGASEIALALPMDFEVEGTIVIPKGMKMTICLNGHKLSGSLALAKNNKSPYMFKVEYGAELHVCDCSQEKTGMMSSISLQEMLQASSSGDTTSVSPYACPIYNLGKATLNEVTLEGTTGIYNAGELTVNDSHINGIYFGVFLNEADAYDDPLHSFRPTVELEGCEILGALAGVVKLGGSMALVDSVINASMIGLLSEADVLEINTKAYNGELLLSDVVINLGSIYPEGDELLQQFVQTIGFVSAFVTNSDIVMEGDLEINVDEWLLEPYLKEGSNDVTSVRVVEFIIGTNTYFDIADGVELTDAYCVAFINQLSSSEAPIQEDIILANKDLSENFVLMEGLVGMLNENGEYVVLASDNCGFIENAIVTTAQVGFDGYVRLDFYCQFDKNETEAQFLTNADARVIFSVAGEKVKIHPSQMEKLDNGLYLYSVNFYAKDYQEKIYVQFSTGKYTWTGKTPISVEDFLEESLLNFEQSLKQVEDTLSNASLTEDARIVAERKKLEIVAYKNAILAMLNYCGVTAEYFYEIEYELLDKSFLYQEVETFVDEATQETREEKVWIETSVTDTMAAVTAETLNAYVPSIQEGSVIPENVQFIGASLILNSGTFIRFYFKTTAETLQGLTVTIDGKTVQPVLHTKESGIYYVQVENLSALQLKSMYTMAITDGKNTFTASYGVFSYMYGVLSNSESSEALMNVAKATWVYANEADNAIHILAGLLASDSEEVVNDDQV